MSRRSERTVSVMAPSDLASLSPGDPRTVGPYTLIGRLGGGHTATVYAGIDPRTAESPVLAIKVLRPECVPDAESRQVLEERLRALSTVGTRCDVPPLDFDTRCPEPWLALPHVGGISLAQYVHKRGPLPEGMLISLASALAHGLAALHRVEVSHGDLKPGNIILTSSGPRILDCALPWDRSLLRHSAAWMSPERHGGEPPSPSGDVFGWGGVIAFAATGRLPYGFGEPEELAERVVKGHFDLDGVPPALLPLVRRALSPDPGIRPTVRELIGATLAAWESTSPGDAPEDAGTLTQQLSREWQGIIEQPPMPRAVRVDDGGARRSRLRIPFIAAGLALALALVGGGVWAGLSVLGEEDAQRAEDAGAAASEATSSPQPATEEPEATVVRFGELAQPRPAEGPWVYTEVEPNDTPDDAELPGGEEAPDSAVWSAQWRDVTDPEEPLEAVIAPDAVVYCAQWCTEETFVDEEGRGQTEVTGQDFINYLGWGGVVIAEVTYADEEAEDGTAEIVEIVELYLPPEPGQEGLGQEPPEEPGQVEGN